MTETIHRPHGGHQIGGMSQKIRVRHLLSLLDLCGPIADAFGLIAMPL